MEHLDVPLSKSRTRKIEQGFVLAIVPYLAILLGAPHIQGKVKALLLWTTLGDAMAQSLWTVLARRSSSSSWHYPSPAS